MEIASKIKSNRDNKGLSQEYMAGCLNISQSAYSKMGKSDRAISLERFKKITYLSETDPADFFNNSNDNLSIKTNQSRINNNLISERVL